MAHCKCVYDQVSKIGKQMEQVPVGVGMTAREWRNSY